MFSPKQPTTTTTTTSHNINKNNHIAHYHDHLLMHPQQLLLNRHQDQEHSNSRVTMVPPPSSTSPTESSTSSGISSQKSNMGLDELIESLSFFVETAPSTGNGTSHNNSSRSNEPQEGITTTTTTMPQLSQNRLLANSNLVEGGKLMGVGSGDGPRHQQSKRELIASMNGTIRRGPGDLELSQNHSERNGGVSWSNQVKLGRERRTCLYTRRR